MLPSLRLTSKRFMSSRIPNTFKSVVYADHDSQDCTNVLSVHNYTPKTPPEESIVLRTLAFPINPSDINQLEGVYPSKPEKTLDYDTERPSAIAGNEGVFEVVHVPLGVENANGVREGDVVIPLQANFGTWSDYRTCSRASDLVKVPGIDLIAAATIAVNACTAYQMVNNYVKWDGGNEWIVQNAGNSSVSRIVSQIAKAQGIKTLSVVRDREDFEQLANELETKYGATKVISEGENNDKQFAKEVLPQILGPDAQVKLALNSVGGKSSASIARKLSRDATMLTYGGMSKMPVTLPTSLHIFKGLKSMGFWVTENSKKDPQSKIDTINALLKLYANGDIVSPKDEVNVVEWDVNAASDDQVLELVKRGITKKGKKNVVVLKW